LAVKAYNNLFDEDEMKIKLLLLCLLMPFIHSWKKHNPTYTIHSQTIMNKSWARITIEHLAPLRPLVSLTSHEPVCSALQTYKNGESAMNIIKVGDDRYINVDRMTYVEPKRKGGLVVHFEVGGGDIAGLSCRMTLEKNEAELFKQWLDGRNQNSQG
jgi:hypothetical protein